MILFNGKLSFNMSHVRHVVFVFVLLLSSDEISGDNFYDVLRNL